MHVESQMLKMYAKLLIEMLTNRDENQTQESPIQTLEKLQIEPVLKCILYECLQAEQKTQKMEEDRYQQEINQHIERATREAQGEDGKDEQELDLVNQFKELVATQKAMDQEQEEVRRLIKRKPTNPIANRINYDEENKRMGVRNEIDLILGEQEKEEAKQKYDRDLIKFSQDIGVVKKEKEQKFLTIQGLLDHPYFIQINEADISIVIDHFESLQQPNYEM